MNLLPIAPALLVLATAAAANEGRVEAIPGPKPGSKAWKAMAASYTASVAPIFEAKCFDCHSARTRFPWYYRLPLVKSLIDLDIRKARRVLDMTDGFPFTGVGTLGDHLQGLKATAGDGSMPPLRYRIIHRSSKLTPEECRMITDWVDGKLALPAPASRKR